MSAKKKTAKRGGSTRHRIKGATVEFTIIDDPIKRDYPPTNPDQVYRAFRDGMLRRVPNTSPAGRNTSVIESASLQKLIESEQRLQKQVDELQARGTDLTLTSRKQAKRIGAFEGFLKVLNEAASILDEQIRAIDRGDA